MEPLLVFIRLFGLEHLLWILTSFAECSKFLYYAWAVFWVGYAKPLRGGVKNLASSLAGFDEVVYHEWDEELALEILLILRVREECLEVFLAVSEIVRGEAPEVHADRSCVRDANPLVVLVEVLHYAVVTLNLGALYNAGEEVSLLVVLAYTTAHCTAVAEGVVYAEAHHSILAGAAFWELAEELAHYHECVSVVEVVAVKYSERLLDNVLTHHYGVVGAPWLLAAFWHGKAFWQGVECLEAEFARN